MRHLGTATLTLILGWGAVAVLGLLVWALPQLPEPLWPLPLVVAAIPLAIWLAEWRLVKRRALLGELTDEAGHLRSLLWSGRLLQLGAVAAAIAITTGLYLSASFLHWQHWAVVAGYVAVLAVAIGPVRDRLRSEVREAHLGLIVRHGPLFWGGVLVLGMGFLALDLVLDQPDLRGASFELVVDTAYREGFESARSASLGTLLGMTNAARMGLWYWAQMIGPQLDSLAWGFWLVFGLVMGGVASLLNSFVLAAIALAERLERPDAGWRPQPFLAGLTAAVVALGTIYAFASHQLSTRSPTALKLPDGPVVAYLDPCRSDRTRQAVAALTADFAAVSRAEEARTAAEIDAAVERAFARLEPGIDAYLDWYFSLRGEYTRLWRAVAGDGAAFLRQRFQDMVLADGDFDARLGRELAAIERRSNGRLREMASHYAHGLRQALDDSRCLVDGLPAGERPDIDGGLRNVSGAAVGSLTGAAAGLAIAARPGANGAVRAITRALGRTAGKRSLSAGGAAAAGTMICSPSGPGAVLCGAAAGVGTWLAVDVLVLWGDEYLNRDAMRAEIMAGLDDTRRQMADALGAANAARIASAAEAIEASRNELFSPVREGLGR